MGAGAGLFKMTNASTKTVDLINLIKETLNKSTPIKISAL